MPVVRRYLATLQAASARSRAGAAPDHAVERRAHAGGGRRRHPHAHHRVGPGRRRRGRAGAGPAHGPAAASSPSTWAAPPPRRRSSRTARSTGPPSTRWAAASCWARACSPAPGYLLRVPAIDLAEVGAGGGSIVWIDAGGALQVGPRSAGAFPGPLCYDLGGTEPTITDANVILGYLNPTAARRGRGQAQRRARARGASRRRSPAASGCRSPRRPTAPT